MARMMRRLVSDELWARVEPHLPVRAAAARTGRSVSSVYQRRQALGVAKRR